MDKELTIKIRLEGAAFGETPQEEAAEVDRILSKYTAQACRRADLDATLFDTNGNRVGEATVME